MRLRRLSDTSLFFASLSATSNAPRRSAPAACLWCRQSPPQRSLSREKFLLPKHSLSSAQEAALRYLTDKPLICTRHRAGVRYGNKLRFFLADLLYNSNQLIVSGGNFPAVFFKQRLIIVQHTYDRVFAGTVYIAPSTSR